MNIQNSAFMGKTIMGHDDWMKQVVEQFEGPLVRYAARLSDDLDLARDAVQDVFLRLWQAESEQRGDHLAAWLFKVCRHRVFDLQRKKRRFVYMDNQTLPVTACPKPAPDAAAVVQENTREALQWLATLPKNQQEVVRLKFQNGLSYQEISQITRLSVTNVGFLIHTAIAALRRKMQGTRQPV